MALSSSFKSLAFVFMFVSLLVSALAAPFSIKQDASPSPSPSDGMDASPEPDDEVCVDALYLTNYAPHQLVHAKHIMADVLCPIDSSLPCATASHMIRIDGNPASYAQYCERYECAENKMEVNSVLSHMWEDEDHGNGLKLTMFDHRHPETVQIALHRLTAVRRDITMKIWQS